MADKMVAEVFPPGEFIREEIEARGWSQSDLADILGRPGRLVSELIAGKRAVTAETAKALGEAFGTGAQFWMNLESVYQLSKTKIADDGVGRRAKLYDKAPVKDLIRRHWIEPSENIEVLERRVLNFFAIPDLDTEPNVWAHAARKSTSYKSVTPSQMAWLFQARHLATMVGAKKFNDASFDSAIAGIKGLLGSAEEARKLPRILAESGIRFVVVEPLPQTRIDGACLWLDESSPVIAISLRFDRIDWFWHTVLHELKHVKDRDGLLANVPIDTDLVGDKAQKAEDKPQSEVDADRFAATFSISDEELTKFIDRVQPLYAKRKIQAFAEELGVHPGIVVGQLQHRGEIKYYHNREMLVRIRNIVEDSALTDGWGHRPTLRPNG